MKKKSLKTDLFVVGLGFTYILSVLIFLLVSSCKSASSCEAYGQNNMNHGNISENKAS